MTPQEREAIIRLDERVKVLEKAEGKRWQVWLALGLMVASTVWHTIATLHGPWK